MGAHVERAREKGLNEAGKKRSAVLLLVLELFFPAAVARGVERLKWPVDVLLEEER
jgi:hypothetical protein